MIAAIRMKWLNRRGRSTARYSKVIAQWPCYPRANNGGLIQPNSSRGLRNIMVLDCSSDVKLSRSWTSRAVSHTVRQPAPTLASKLIASLSSRLAMLRSLPCRCSSLLASISTLKVSMVKRRAAASCNFLGSRKPRRRNSAALNRIAISCSRRLVAILRMTLISRNA